MAKLGLLQRARVAVTFDDKKRKDLISKFEKDNAAAEKARENRNPKDTFKYDLAVYAGVSARNCDTHKSHPIELRISTNGTIYRLKQIGTGAKNIGAGFLGLFSNVKAMRVEHADSDQVVQQQHQHSS